MKFEDAAELLESLRAHELAPGETIIPWQSYTGTVVGFSTADGPGPATRWLISLVDLRSSCGARTSSEALGVYQRMKLHHLRIGLIRDLRSGMFPLERPPSAVHLTPAETSQASPGEHPGPSLEEDLTEEPETSDFWDLLEG